MSDSNSKHFYITTTLPYLNADPHMGHALEFVQADIIARGKRLEGFEVVFNTGTDEHGLKIFRQATGANLPIQDYVDVYSLKFKALKEKLNLSYTHFIRTTDPHHKKAAEEFWKICDKNGDIYKGVYEVKYCVGCELEKTDAELDDGGHCPIHPNMEIEFIKEENYFFRYSKYQQALIDHYAANEDFVVPETRFNEIKAFVSRGLQDFSISRRKDKMPWGIPVPGDDEHVMYVWFDALVNYISTLGWPENADDEGSEYKKFWPGMQIAGKDNLRQQSAMWQAMLLSAKVPLSRQIFIHGFINSGGKKMSKSLGNVIDPIMVAEEYGIDALRYYLAREISSYEDGDFTMERFKEVYNANLANGVGNLTSRIMKMAETHLSGPVDVPETSIPKEFFELLGRFEISKACDLVWKEISALDTLIQETAPFKVIKEDKMKGEKLITELAIRLYGVGRMLNPILPETSEKIKAAVKANKMPEASLFVRKD